MYLKIMSCETLPDQHWAKCYVMYDCKRVSFVRQENGSVVADIDGEIVGVTGTAYILNAAGKTIDSYSPDPITP